MNARRVLSGNSAQLTSFRPRVTRRRKSAARPQREVWFTSDGAARDNDLRKVVAERFMSMNEAHDRIRLQLLSGRSS